MSTEYNGSVSGGIKNAIDWMSRPRADAPIASKPSVTFAGSPSAFGGVWAGADLRRVLKIAGAKVLNEDDLPLSGIDTYRESGIPEETYAAIMAVVDRLVDAIVAQPVS